MLLACPAGARAQSTTRLTRSPASVWVDGLGALQVRLEGSATGQFAPDEYPAHAGLELLQAGSSSPVGDTARAALSRPQLDEPAAETVRATSVFAVGALKVTERVLLDYGQAAVRLEYDIENTGAAPVPVRAAALADIAGQTTGWTEATPRFIGARDRLRRPGARARLGRRVGLVEDTVWQRSESHPDAFAHFRAGGLSGQVDQSRQPHAV